MTTAQAVRRKKLFLDAFRVSGNISRSAAAVNVPRRTAYNWREADPEFAVEFAEAEQEAADLLETEARRRAVEGVTRKKFGPKGEPLIDPDTGKHYVEREYSDTLLIFLLKGARPEKYAHFAGTQVNIDNRTQVHVDQVILEVLQARQQLALQVQEAAETQE